MQLKAKAEIHSASASPEKEPEIVAEVHQELELQQVSEQEILSLRSLGVDIPEVSVHVVGHDSLVRVQEQDQVENENQRFENSVVHLSSL